MIRNINYLNYILFILGLFSCNHTLNTSYQNIDSITSVRSKIPYECSFLENLSPNCDSFTTFFVNNVRVDSLPFQNNNGYVGVVLNIENIKPRERYYDIRLGINYASDISMYINKNCINSHQDFDLLIDTIFSTSPIAESWRDSLYNNKLQKVIGFSNIWGGAVFLFKKKKGYYCSIDTYITSDHHGMQWPAYSSISDAYLENRTKDCDDAYSYSKRNIVAIKSLKKLSYWSQQENIRIYVPGINSSNSICENLKKAQLERLFIRLDCLVGMSSNEIFKLFCHPTQINDFKKWEKTYYFWNKTKILEIKFKDFPSKGIYVKLENGIVVDSGILE